MLPGALSIFSAAAAVSNGNDIYTKSLLHFDRFEGSSYATESAIGAATRKWTAWGTGGTVRSQSKFGGSAFNFGGSNWLETPAHADFNFGGDFTIDCWFRDTGSGTATRTICGQQASGGSDLSFALRLTLNASNYVLHAMVSSNGTAQTHVYGTTNLVPNSGWHHAALVRKGNVLKLFLNGVQEGGDVAFTGPVWSSAAKMAIGRAGDNATLYWAGLVDEFRISKGIARWSANFTLPTREYGEVGIDADTKLLLQGDGNNGSVNIFDSSLAQRGNGTLTGQAQLSTVQSKFSGSSILLDGAGDYITFPDHADWAHGNNDFTIDLWLRVAAVTSGYYRIFSQMTTIADGIFFGYHTNLGLDFRVRAAGVDNVLIATANNVLALNTWHHVAAVRSGNVWTLYVDGVAVGTQTAAVPVADYTGAAYIGALSNASEFVNGNIDEFRISSNARWGGTFAPPSSPYVYA